MATLPIVRRSVRVLLESAPAFRALPPDARKRIAQDTVRVATYMVDPDGLVSREFRAPLLRERPGRFSRLLVVELGPTLQGGTPALDALVNGVDFPDFVASLVHGVFNAVVHASIEQMEAFAALVADVAASVAEFMSESISEQAARDTLTNEFPELFCRTEATKTRLAWRRSDGAPHAGLRLQAALGMRRRDLDLRSLVAATRRRLARNRQQTLATIVLMGINRIVVTDGKIAPRIRFDLARRPRPFKADSGRAAAASRRPGAAR